MSPGDDLHITDSSASGGGAPLARGSESLSGRVAKQRNLSPESDRNRSIGLWALGRSVTVRTELLWTIIKRQKYNMDIGKITLIALI